MSEGLSERDHHWELLRRLHNWFLQEAPEKYAGCGLYIDVKSVLRVRPSHAELGSLRSPSAHSRPVEGVDAWRSIESAPRDGSEVDLWVHWPEHDRWCREPNVRWNAVAGQWQFDNFHAGQFLHPPRATHWMPLPSAPTEDGARDASGAFGGSEPESSSPTAEKGEG